MKPRSRCQFQLPPDAGPPASGPWPPRCWFWKRRKKKDKNDAGAADDEAKKKACREKKRQADRLRRQNPVFQVEAARRKRKAREAAG